MRARGIKPAFFKNDDLAAQPPHARLLFIGLWGLADREGRLEDRPMRIKGEVFPYEGVDAEDLLNRLSAAGFILRYSVDGAQFIEVCNFKKHQYPHSKEAPSAIPAPDGRHGRTKLAPDEHQTSAIPEPVVHGTRTDLAPVEHPLTPDSCIRTADSGLLTRVATTSVPKRNTASTPFLVYPTKGEPSAWTLTEEQLAAWEPLYEGHDLRALSRQALAWVDAKPERKKTARGMKGFLVGWFGRARGGPQGGGGQSSFPTRDERDASDLDARMTESRKFGGSPIDAFMPRED